jgi:hypothetical protein
MSVYSQKDLEYLVGLDRVPVKGPVPAVWWITVNPDQLDAFDRFKADYAIHLDKVDALAKTLGLNTAAGRTSSWAGKTWLTGFDAPQGMYFWPSHPDHIPVPDGWRLDRKKDRLVPSRKTKADRESQVNKDFAAVEKIPDVQAYVTGLPTTGIYIEDRGFGGGTIYTIHYWRGRNCVAAYTGGDPDRCTDELNIDTAIWHRQKLSALVALREQAAA